MWVMPGARVSRAVLALLPLLSAPALAQTAPQLPGGGPVGPQGSGSPSVSARVPAPVVIVVDHQAVIQQSVAGRAVRAQRDKYVQGFQSEFDAGRKALKEMEGELLKQKAVLSADAWQQKTRAFEKEVFDFNKRFQATNQAIEKSFRQAMTELNQAVIQVIEEVATETGANLVLPSQQTILQDPRLEVTATVVDRLNRRFTSVNFPPPVLDGEGAKPTARPGKK